jgi:threonine/homoserine/homoserine lactone efflux protein
MAFAGIHNFTSFLLAGILLNLIPGNDTIYIVSRTIAQGKKAGLFSVFGIATGSLVHTTLAAFGLSLIIAKSIVAFNILRFAGAVYLAYLGIKMFYGKRKGIDTVQVTKQPLYVIYYQAVITNVLNPKVALFFISFLPQFINPEFSKPYLSFMLLGLTFTTTGTLWCIVLALFASVISSALKRSSAFSGWINKLCGLTLIGLGIKVALTNKS